MDKYDKDMIDKLNDIADKIWEHVEAGGGILDEYDHDRMAQTIEELSDMAQTIGVDEVLMAAQRARDAMRRWNKEEYPYLEDILSDMYPEGIDDGDDLYDEEE